MSRAEFERDAASGRGHTVTEMRKAGWYSAKESKGSEDWQAFAIPPADTRREHQDILKRFTEPDDLEPKLFGEVSA
jgi:ribosomal protein L13E